MNAVLTATLKPVIAPLVSGSHVRVRLAKNIHPDVE